PFLTHRNAREIVTKRALEIDRLLDHIWENNGRADSDSALLAVGGYGRGELHPYSDVDIAIIVPMEPTGELAEKLQRLVTCLWELGLDIGHSVRTLEQAIDAAEQDITVMTNLLECRFLSGNERLFEQLTSAVRTHEFWPPQSFFSEKTAEQQQRYRRFDDALQQLEPNIKESPGGLRDIQTIAWVANRHFESGNLRGLLDHGFLHPDEYATLDAGEEFLWRVRCALHFLTGRHEDRLALEHQKSVAEALGYEGNGPNEAVELLMKDYYRTVREISCVNEMLLDLFEQAILRKNQTQNISPVNRRFQLRDKALDVIDEAVFERAPHAMLELFLILQQNPEVTQISAKTIRLLLANRHKIDSAVREDLRAQSLFMEIIRQPRRIGHELRRMHKYGVLSAYLPVFAKVEGLMQFDLFHIYTVDEHALFVLQYMRRFSFPQGDADKITLIPYVIERIPKLELLYIAGLYHDIAKGRGGDHSQLGAEEAAAFCKTHGLSNFDTHLVAWLVRNHLLMSTIAQRKDIYDPTVIAAFADEVGEQIYLDYLYLLTVADIRGTDPKLFNGWKESLLAELYSATRRFLSDKTSTTIDSNERSSDMRKQALESLAAMKFAQAPVESLWQTFDEDYFMRHRVAEIVWHSSNILNRETQDSPLVCVDNFDHREATAIFIYAEDSQNLFARTTAALDKLQLDIQDARISTTSNGYTLDTYMALDSNQLTPITDSLKIERIVTTVVQALTQEEMPTAPLTRAASRALRHFDTPVKVDFEYDEAHRYTIMGVNAVDRPGLLSMIGQIMRKFGIQLHDARIATIGERAEDYFCITRDPEQDADQRASTDIPLALQQQLRDAITTALQATE
ncbi:MAG: [protein-PII] uridylyltransferase, partial [Pseudomonadota bacterium]